MLSNQVKKDRCISVAEYHRRSKHSLQQYAAGPDSLDWDTQPDPWRRYSGCPRFSLPLPAKNLIVDFDDIYHPQRITPAIVDKNTLGALFELSLGLSAWKMYGPDRWALRMNPSSGNLHPTEAYLVFAGTGIIPAGIYHYDSHDHCLEQRCNLKARQPEIASLLENNSFLIGLSSIHWREAWKYGERAYRYCQHDVGHAIGSIRYAAAVLGWRVSVLEHCSDQQLRCLLGLEHISGEAESESPDLLLLVSRMNQAGKTGDNPDIRRLAEVAAAAEWKGDANILSPHNRVHWDIIDQVTAACEKPETECRNWQPMDQPMLTQCTTELDAASIIRMRRSAQAFDARTELALTKFYRILDSALPRHETTPYDSLPWQPRIHLVLFVHRVEGLRPGLYVFPRSKPGEAELRNKLRDSFDWSRPPICPETLPLFHLVSASSQNAARTVSCHQAIAADGAFSISMLAEFQPCIADSPWRYRQLFWEAGLLGQNLYLEAEAVGIRATGIGCYFDDAVHEILGIDDESLQVIYHFTLGTPVLDSRLISLPPYGHLKPET